MHFPDMTPLFWLAAAFVGAAAGLLLALGAWAVAPLNWWTFALPAAGATVGFVWAAFWLK